LYTADAVEFTGILSGCYATGNVDGNSTVGGLAGWNFGTISNCYASGQAIGAGTHIGGLAGYDNGVINNSYAAGRVTGTGIYIGGLLGGGSGAYTKSFWNSTVNPDVNGIGGIGNTDDPNVICKTTAEMQDVNTFLVVGWDFVGEAGNGPNDIWAICSNDCGAADYPKLAENLEIPSPLGELLDANGVDFIDYAIFADCWNDTGCGGQYAVIGQACGSDLTGDGIVDMADLKAFVEDWMFTND